MRQFHRAAQAVALAAGLALGASAHAVDVNVATAEQLETLRGIGPKTAQTIVRERARSGPFHSLQDFTERIRGIGPKRAAALQAAGLRVGAEGGAAAGLGATAGGLDHAARAAPVAAPLRTEPVITTVAPFYR